MCGIIGVIDRRRQMMDGGKIRDSLAMMDERGSGEGAGYVAYGIYPDYKDYFALHVFFDNIRENKGAIDNLLEKWGTIIHDEQIKTYAQPNLRKVHTPWRYFSRPDRNLMPKSTHRRRYYHPSRHESEFRAERGPDLLFRKKPWGFQAAGWPEDVANFYRIEDYKGYLWLAHNRYPTNTSGWWGGAHPFNLLNWSVVHNGEITSYGTNRRDIESYGYKCTMFTDTEVVAYLVDLLVRKHGLPRRWPYGACPPVLGGD